MLQVVLNKDTLKLHLEDISVEATVQVKGKLRKATLKDRALNPANVELEATDVQIATRPTLHPLPLDTSKKELHADFSTILDLRPLSLRHPRERALFRIQAGIFNQFGRYLSEIGFTRICSPKLVFSGAEGGANVFKIDYFGRLAYLAQSPQFYKQMMVGVFGRVFEEAPVFRAEKHNTSRHLNEYISLDIEMQLAEGFMDIIQVEAHALNSILEDLREACRPELELLGVKLPRLDEVTALEFPEAKEIVFKESGMDHRSEPDLSPEEERLISQYAKDKWDADFVFVTHYPSAKRPFYAMNDPMRPELTLSFDLLFRGMEITTGGQRLHRYEDYVSKMTARGMDITAFEPYLQTFKYGMPPHGGFGLGLERLTAKLCGVENIKACSLFPRDLDRLTP
jgi:nondiscriminating aspartyl-tRNA synthetase